ncbi:MAG TPA: sugar transferase [Acidimicrobiia bacterium]
MPPTSRSTQLELRNPPETRTPVRRTVDDEQDLLVFVGPPADQLVVDLRPRVMLEPEVGLLGASRFGIFAKRSIDLLLGSVALVVLSPVLVTAMLLVRISSPGPAFYRQERVGRDGAPFSFAKFRTMRVGADLDRDELSAQNECEGPIFKIREDPRITAVGRLLRKFSIDELPQLVHVVTGKMSLVGPRPPLPQEVEQYGAWEKQRLTVKPGITCIWQVSGRSDLDFETWVHLDVDYIARWSLKLDLGILARTIPAVISGKGAY